ncbi:MAG: hemagglutinin repeat-containing protein, partial [Brachymonas sp.]|nr:hemagglutinin repeat-containing protein [Brachymonas sp.]
KGTIITTPGQIKLSAPTVLTDAAAKVTTNTVTTSQGGVTLQGYAKLAPSVGMGTIANGQGSTTVNSNSVAVASQFNGGQINVDGSQSVTDTGTRYAATSDVNIQAPAYTGNAAHNAQVSTVNSGNATLGLDVYTTTFADVNAQIGLKGAYQYQQTGQSQAVLGNIQAQNVNITADKSINSSMNIDAANNATLSAGQDVTLAQANNQQWRLQGGFSAGGSIGVQFVPPGAVTPSGSVSGSINYLNVQDSQAVASSVKAGNNVALSATGSATAQGAQVTAGNAFSMQADQVAFNAGNDYHKASGVSTDGTASLKLGFSKSGEVGSGTAGIGGDLAVVHENGYTEHGGSITAQNVNLTANSASQDLTVAGATINATNVNLSNAAGNVSVVAAKGASQKANVGFGANLGAGASKSKGLSSFNVGGHLNITTDDSTYYKLGQINAQNVSIAAGKDFNLQGGVQTDSLNGKVSGNVNISSPQTRQNTLQLDLAANVGDSVIFNPKSTATDYIKAIGNDISSQNGSPNKSSSSQQSLFGITLNGLFNLQAHDSLTTQASKVNVGQMNLVPDGGQVSINAAQVSSSGGQGFGNAKVNTSSNQDYVHAMSGSISGGLPSIPAILTNLANGTPVPPPVTATTPQLTWTQSQVDPSVSVK